MPAGLTQTKTAEKLNCCTDVIGGLEARNTRNILIYENKCPWKMWSRVEHHQNF